MYCEYWKLREPPFENVPNPRFVYYSTNHDEALMRLIYTVKGRKGACMLTGDVGTGKTTISKVFQDKLQPRAYQVAMITNPNLSSVDLLRSILHALEAGPGEGSKLDLLHGLQRHMLSNCGINRDTVIIIDEAHLIRDRETFEELRLLLNFQQSDRFMLTLVLAGQPELKEAIHGFPQFEQRIAIKYHLKPLLFADTCKYIQFRLRTAGVTKQIFTAEAARRIYDYSGGIPRKINNICDMSLLAGFVDARPLIDEGTVEKIIREEA